MTTSSYFIAWIIYLLAVSGIGVVAWNLSRTWRLELKLISRTALLVLLLTPYFSDPAQNKLAPAILICLFEFVFGDIEVALKAGMPLTVLLVLSSALALVYALAHRKAK